jgi:hypothetical protein
MATLVNPCPATLARCFAKGPRKFALAGRATSSASMADGCFSASKARDIKEQARSVGPEVKKALFFLPKIRLDLVFH